MLVGVALGAAGTLLTVRGRIAEAGPAQSGRQMSREEAEERFVARMVERLQLDETQEQQVRLILNEGRARFKEAEKKKDAEARSIRREMNDQIRALLRPEQQQSFEEFLEHLRNRRHRKEARPREAQENGS